MADPAPVPTDHRWAANRGRRADNGRKFYKWRNDPFSPVEFFVAAYRFGHSQVRPSYRANFGTSGTDLAQQFFALIFDSAATDPADLRGGLRAVRRFIDWQTFFDFGDNRARPNKKIDTILSTPLFHLLGQPPATPTSLASRNLLRGLTMGLPSGQRGRARWVFPNQRQGICSTLSICSCTCVCRSGSTSCGRRL